MKSILLILLFCFLMTQTQASEGSLTSENLDIDTIEYWILETD